MNLFEDFRRKTSQDAGCHQRPACGAAIKNTAGHISKAFLKRGTYAGSVLRDARGRTVRTMRTMPDQPGAKESKRSKAH
eukprot:1161059-Pelagomonas_calceolata.AAC.5